MVALGLGCMPVGNYHSARTLNRGESSLGFTFSSTTYTDPDDGDSVTIPGIIPEITYHVGVTDNLEVGGRVAPGFLYGEVDAKYRFLRGEGLHLAVAPAVGQMAFLVTVTTVRLPLLLTYELSPNFAFNAGVNATFWNVSNVDPDADEDSPFGVGDDHLTTTGVSLGVEISGRTAYFRPSIEFTRGVFGADDQREAFQLGAAVLHFGIIFGREMAAIDEMDRKLDEINDKLSWRYRYAPAE
ncbi:hypothetical protein [Haliangium sp.]|uniref:hypothetical protein n=1 Tax=Haliangium sp. TaxID=2663208 RepID=UPI003D0B7F6E